MHTYYRLVIDTLKHALSDYIATGNIDSEELDNAIKQLEFETDKRIVEREPVEELSELRNDLLWVKCDLI